ncbi:hypothetical protein REC12_22180 [Desulfosporosinus sp. PR]|uniref:hypothetical protein n=1 Tax=Candidatus Desulfosporosinus nitrosoreducens TaxID=3401928 RepID=UPI0027FB6869|nr:hypothetical protein [Desulfosporosinus sp. PR]MDQ7096306.1 hypothetical protein [Desulfosporosinus sp. PR]
MRRRATMTLRGNKDLLKEVFEKVKNYATSAELIANLRITIYQDTVGFKILMDEINAHDIKYTFAEGREYTKEELKAAVFFDMEIIYPWESDGKTAEKFGTMYKNTCKSCSIGKNQISDLIIDTKKAAKYDICIIQPEIIINERIYNLINENSLTGCNFRPIKDFKGREEVVLYQLLITNVLPSMSKNISVEIVDGFKCGECKRNGEILRSEVIYDNTSLHEASDFNLTQEYFGLNLYCGRNIIVSSKVYSLFNKIRLNENKIK